jgi:hypothetical protein
MVQFRPEEVGFEALPPSVPEAKYPLGAGEREDFAVSKLL